ncbi:hypothetical protein B2J93_554 [Marssonina coronariae]|uniref:Uncharacterized protein n=1 Tax=Diplocarpon coronariae TaxID=2795749 RepID=A0A218Z9F9_9HELO|nr:hypothetical protein B2J93_554 [Marssonina coronariae]
METVTSIASAASRAIWGDGSPEDKPATTTTTTTTPTTTTTTPANETAGTEPVAGEVGDVEKGEPYDKGNAGKDATAGTAFTLPSHPRTTDSTTLSSLPSPPSADEGLVLKSADPTVPPTSAPTSSTSIATLTPASITAAEAAAVPTKLPEAGESKEIGETKTAAAEAVSGPGPQSLGNSAVVIGGAIAPPKESLGTATIVKSDGRKADGGDFDAENAGAGKEADRHSETKGTSYDAATAARAVELAPTKSTDDDDSPQEKKKLSEKLGIDKLKAKLHIHKE